MPTPSRRDAITVLVFLGVGSLGIVLLSGAIALAESFLSVGDVNDILEVVTSLVVLVVGGSFAAHRYRVKADG